MKNLAKRLVVSILNWQVRRLRKNNELKVIGVVGSIGKTSTKYAIAKVLDQELKVRHQAGNYNVPVTVPLIFFGLEEPSLYNPLAWLLAFIKIEKQLSRKYSYDAVIIEIGTDGPGQIQELASSIDCDIAVLTAISLEHMEFFSGLDQVAEEELSISKFSKSLILNIDLCPDKYLREVEYLSYGLNSSADYQISDLKLSDGRAEFNLSQKDSEPLKLVMKAIAHGEVYSAAAAAVVAKRLGLSNKSIQQGVKEHTAVSGRMQQLKGIKNSLIIDESYNSSPEAAFEALDTLYRIEAQQKIAVLGNMNELGVFSAKAHQDVGKHCDPKKLDLVVTIGPDANKYLASVAKDRGCQVISFDDPYSLGKDLKDQIKASSAILFKGSQNTVFLEEAIKIILAEPSDSSKLVRQSKSWLAIKATSFPKN